MSPEVAAEVLEEIRLIREIIAEIREDLRPLPKISLKEQNRRSRERFEAMMRDWQERYQ